MKIFASLVAAAAVVASLTSTTVPEAPSLEFVGSVSLPGEARGIRIQELSALAYDPVTALVWAISDKGDLHGFKVEYNANVPIAMRHVRSARLDTMFRNAEGMAWLPSTRPGTTGRLLVAFEDGPALISFTTKGASPVHLKLPAPLDNPAAYAEANSRLESIAVDPRGRFLTAPEEALLGRLDTEHTIFTSDGTSFRLPTFQAHRSNLKALEYLGDTKRILVLERTRDEAGASTMRLRLVVPGTCTASAVCGVIELIPDKPAAFAGNFEGLTRLRGDYYAAVTDAKYKDKEPTRIVFFKIDDRQK
jgi:hypothetical protein